MTPTLRQMRRIILIVLIACSALDSVLIIKSLAGKETYFPDFFGIWTFGRFVLTHPPATIYDNPVLYAFQNEVGMPLNDGAYPFPYPPWILLPLALLGLLPYGAARIVWLLATFVPYAASVSAWRWPRPVAALLVLAPSSAICFFAGQNGFLSAALMLGGLRLLRSRPFLAGALLATLAYKPQLAVLIPFVLIFGRHWKAAAAAALTAGGLTLATTFAFGADIWTAWLTCIQAQLTNWTAGRGTLLDMMPTVTSSVLLLGGSVTMSRLAQIASGLFGVFAIWRVRESRSVEAIAVPPLATFMTTPYAFHYDLPMVTGAILLVVAARISAARQSDKAEIRVLLACVVGQMFLWQIGAVSIVLPALMAAALWVMVHKVAILPPAFADNCLRKPQH